MNSIVPALVSHIDFSTLDLLPYGIIVLDSSGNVIFYNSREEEIAGRNRMDVLGKNFFTDVAPCTQLGTFHDKFLETMIDEGLTAEFAFHFPFKPIPRDVEISLTSFNVDHRPL